MGYTYSAAWGAAIEEWSSHARNLGEAQSSIAARRQQLGRLAKTIGTAPWNVTGTALCEWFAAQPWANETRRSRRTTYRVFYAWAVEAGHVTQSPAIALPRVRPSVPHPLPVPDRAYTLALLAAGDRERLMLRLAAEVGLRRGEVARVHTRDLIEDLDGWSLLVHGKGDKERIVPLPGSLAAAVRAVPAGFLFPGRDNGHLSPRWVGKVITRLLPEPYSMHKLRHRFATRAHEACHDIAVVQELLGHASPTTTKVYVQIGRDRLRAAVEAAA